MNFAGLLIVIEFDNIVGSCVKNFMHTYEDILVCKGVFAGALTRVRVAMVITFFMFISVFLFNYFYSDTHVYLMDKYFMLGFTAAWYIVYNLVEYCNFFKIWTLLRNPIKFGDTNGYDENIAGAF